MTWIKATLIVSADANANADANVTAQNSEIDAPDPEMVCRFRCGDCLLKSTKSTLLMKLVSILYKKGRRILTIIENIIKASPEQINYRNELGYTALMIACGYSTRHTIKCVELLLQSGANPNLQNNCGETALMLASRSYSANVSPALITLLLQHGADVNIVDNNKNSALSNARACNFISRMYKNIN